MHVLRKEECCVPTAKLDGSDPQGSHDFRGLGPEFKSPTTLDEVKGASQEEASKTRQAELDCKTWMKQFTDRTSKFEENKIKACAHTFHQKCTKCMQLRVMENPKFETEIRDNPAKSTQEIKKKMLVLIKCKCGMEVLPHHTQDDVWHQATRWLKFKGPHH
eukprot:1033938-Ditylum_brightwellii.AAC.3